MSEYYNSLMKIEKEEDKKDEEVLCTCEDLELGSMHWAKCPLLLKKINNHGNN